MAQSKLPHALTAIACIASSLCGPGKARKQITDANGDSRFTSDALEIMNALHSEHAALAIIQEALEEQMRACGTTLKKMRLPIDEVIDGFDSLARGTQLRLLGEKLQNQLLDENNQFHDGLSLPMRLAVETLSSAIGNTASTLRLVETSTPGLGGLDGDNEDEGGISGCRGVQTYSKLFLNVAAQSSTDQPSSNTKQQHHPLKTLLVRGSTLSEAHKLQQQVRKSRWRVANALRSEHLLPSSGAYLCACAAELRVEAQGEDNETAVVIAEQIVDALSKLTVTLLQNTVQATNEATHGGSDFFSHYARVRAVQANYMRGIRDVGDARFYATCHFGGSDFCVLPSSSKATGKKKESRFDDYSSVQSAFRKSLRLVDLALSVAAYHSWLALVTIALGLAVTVAAGSHVQLPDLPSQPNNQNLLDASEFFICGSHIDGMDGKYVLQNDNSLQSDPGTPIFVRDGDDGSETKGNAMAVSGSRGGAHHQQQDIRLFRHNGFWMFSDVSVWPPTTHFRCDPNQRHLVPPELHLIAVCQVNLMTPPRMGYSPVNPDADAISHLVLHPSRECSAAAVAPAKEKRTTADLSKSDSNLTKLAASVSAMASRFSGL